MRAIVIVVALFSLINRCEAQIRLPQLIRDSMVLQRDARINVWGWASGGEKVNVRFNGKTYKTKATADGKWLIVLPPMRAGGPYSMDISGSNKITLKEILIGDVWMCSGQSNMVHQMSLHSVRYADDVASANYPEIRHFWIPTLTDLRGPREDLPVGNAAMGWRSANPKNVLDFSAVAYFFARKIYEKYHVPIGLINASVGGTPIEAWISEEGLKDFSALTATIQKMKDTAYVNSTNRAAAAAAGARPRQPASVDLGLSESTPWYDINYKPQAWHRYFIPGYWADQGIKGLNGVVWFRKEIDVPASMTGVPAKLFMGRI